MKRVSIVIPMYNEEKNVDALRQRLCNVLNGLTAYAFEIVFVDDGSTDGTRARTLAWRLHDARVRYLRLSRNFGTHAAWSAGLHTATGDCAIIMAADLQNPPETIPALLEKWEDGYRVVWATRVSREGEPWTTLLTSKIYWWLMRTGSQNAAPPVAADFALLDRRVVGAYNQLNTRNESVLASICWLGFEAAHVQCDRAARTGGQSGWTLSKKIKLLIDSVVAFSYWPIRAMSVLGLSCAGIGFVLLACVVCGRLFGGIDAPGGSALMSVMLIGMGLLMVMIGVLGEYVWRVLDEARGRPSYVIAEEVLSIGQGAEDGSWSRCIQFS